MDAKEKKPALSVLLALGKPGAKGGDDEAAEGESDTGDEGSSLDAAQALIDALESKDAAAVDSALKLHYDLCCEAE